MFTNIFLTLLFFLLCTLPQQWISQFRRQMFAPVLLNTEESFSSIKRIVSIKYEFMSVLYLSLVSNMLSSRKLILVLLGWTQFKKLFFLNIGPYFSAFIPRNVNWRYMYHVYSELEGNFDILLIQIQRIFSFVKIAYIT